MVTQVHTEHSITVSVPPQAAFWLISDVRTWPVCFPPTVHAERISGDDSDERIQIWALANGELRTWISRRRQDRGKCRIEFAQEVSQPPVASMTGTWTIEPLNNAESNVVLTHDYSAIGDDSEDLALIFRAVDKNSRAELAALKKAAEQHAERDDLLLQFSDSELIDGPVAQAYDFVYRCQDWPERLPHVSRIVLREDVPGLQLMEMDTRAPDGSVHTTSSGRVCFPDSRIVYKQTQVPPILAAHCGEWLFEPTSDGTRVTSRHVVLIKLEAVPELLGPGATVEQAKARVRQALGTNSMTTMRRAKAYVEGEQPEKAPRSPGSAAA
jgi:ribosome-associated toxin RatA of RatAB toxin-antitoxin module